MSFRVGEKVVYPNQGVGVVEQIGLSPMNGRAEKYYLIRILASGLKVTVPVPNADTVGLRRTIKTTDVSIVLRRLENGTMKIPRDWKTRFKQNCEKMRTGSLHDVADVIKSLLRMNQTKPLSFREKKMLDRARHLLVSELAVAKKSTEDTMESVVRKALSKNSLSLPEIN